MIPTTAEPNNINLKARQKARILGMQALYQWHLTEADIADIRQQFYLMNNMAKCDTVYFDALLETAPKNIHAIDDAFSSYLDRSFTELNPVELAILRLGTYELLYLDTPYRVVLKEMIRLGSDYGSQDGYKYVNGILHHVAQAKNAPK